MERITQQVFDMMDELQEHWAVIQKNAENGPKKDEFGYPFEPDNVFSTEPLGFTESVLRLDTQATEMMRFVYSLNRHSPLFAKASSQLEKMIRQLGIFCITKAVLEQQGNEFMLLEDLTISRLRRMTAFNVRKCYAAFMEDRELNLFNSSVMDLSIRWSVLDKRLLATEERIEKIKTGKEKFSLSDKAKTSGPAAENAAEADRTDEVRDDIAPLSDGGRSLPVDKGTVSVLGKQEAVPEAAELPAEPLQAEPEAPEFSDEAESADAYLPDETDLSDADQDEDDVFENDADDLEYLNRIFFEKNLPNLAERAIGRHVEARYTAPRMKKILAGSGHADDPP